MTTILTNLSEQSNLPERPIIKFTNESIIHCYNCHDKIGEFVQIAPLGLLFGICSNCRKTSTIKIDVYSLVRNNNIKPLPKITDAMYTEIKCYNCLKITGKYKQTRDTDIIFDLCMHCKVYLNIKVDIYFINQAGEKKFI